MRTRFISPFCWRQCAILLLSLVILTGSAVRAQSTSSGRISGQVTDPGNATVEGAAVVLTDISTNAKQLTNTNEVGRYIFLNVRPGVYDLTISKSGFSPVRVAAQTVNVGQELTLNATLAVGSTSSAIEVRASAGAELQTSNATVGTTITGPSIMNLPNLGRDANAFFVLQPAVTPNGEVGGNQTDQTQFLLDGGTNTDDQAGNHSYTTSPGNMGVGGPNTPSGIMPTPVDTIEEFSVGVANQSADFNGAAGGQVQMVTKRGTNQFHGSAYDYYFAGNWGANTWQGNHTPSRDLPYTPLPSTHQNRFGGSIGGPLTPSFWGGKTYFFFAYEGRRFPNVSTINRQVPTPLLRAGVIQVADASGRIVPYNLNPVPVTVNGVTYQPAVCPAGDCDPRSIGLNPLVSQVWNKWMPLPNDPQGGDRYNTQGYFTPVRLPANSNFAVARIDHDFGSNWRLMTGYRYYKFLETTNRQIDIGGILSGDSLGNATATTINRQTPSYLVAGLSGVITPHLINDFHFNYLRNAWEWISAGAPAQLPGLGGTMIIGGDGGNQLVPLQVDRGSGLARFWDGQDKVFRDDVSYIHRNHVFQFGGQWNRNTLKHQRNDNGSSIMSAIAYEITSGPGIAMPSAYIPATVPANQLANYARLYAIVLGMDSQSQVFYARKNGQLLPVGSSIFGEYIVPTYNLYFTDTWKIKPTLTLTYGLGYVFEMPAYEVNGNLPMVTYTDGSDFSALDYLAKRKEAALTGQVYNPILGFATIRNVKGQPKYPFDPFYGGVSPRFAVAWSPKYTDGILGKLLASGKTVLRAGYARRYNRINGINQVQVPLQGLGIGQPVVCIGPSRTGDCLGAGGADPVTAFRIGTDGLTAPLPGVSQTLPQPYFPGVGGNAPSFGTSELDPRLQPSSIDQVDVTIQRELTRNVKIELGYIGMSNRGDQMFYNLDSVPYMTTLNGQTFAQAYSSLYLAASSGAPIQPQPFFESALGGAKSPYCAAFASCTAAVAANQRTNLLTTRFYDLWSALNAAPGWTLGRTMVSSNPVQVSGVSMAYGWGWSNYNAAFLSTKLSDWHGVTATSNLTFGRALGTGGVVQSGLTSPIDQWNPRYNYGVNPFDLKWIYNLLAFYRIPVFKDQHGIPGHLLGGWGFAPLFTASSGAPLRVNASSTTGENAVPIAPMSYSNSAFYNLVSNGVAGTAGNASKGGSGINMFADPSAVYSNFRRWIFGIDGKSGGAGVVRGFPTWNLDLAVMKDIRFRERIGATLSFQFVNALNHFQPANPSLSIDSPTNFGVVTSQANAPRQMEIGLRLFF